MIYMESVSLGWEPLLISWLNTLPSSLNDFHKNTLKSMFFRFCGPLIWLLKRGGARAMCPASNSHLLRSIMNLFDCFMDDFNDEKFMEQISDLDVRAQLEGVFFFSCIWSVGGILEDYSRPKFNLLFRGLMEREFPKDIQETLGINFEIAKPEKPYIFTIPVGDVFQFRYIKEVS